MRRMMIATSLLLVISTTAMAGQIYKWVDAQGITHFGAQPPYGQQATPVNTAAPPSLGSEPVVADEEEVAVESADDPEQAEVDRKVKQELAAQEAKRKKYCEDVRTTLAQLQNNPRIRMEVDGEVKRLSEKERQQRISEALKGIEEHCK